MLFIHAYYCLCHRAFFSDTLIFFCCNATQRRAHFFNSDPARPFLPTPYIVNSLTWWNNCDGETPHILAHMHGATGSSFSDSDPTPALPPLPSPFLEERKKKLIHWVSQFQKISRISRSSGIPSNNCQVVIRNNNWPLFTTLIVLH